MQNKIPLVNGLCALALAALVACGGSGLDSSEVHFDLSELTVGQIQQGYALHQFTAEAVTLAYLKRIERHETDYNAFTSMNAQALEQAREIDRRRSKGETLGPMAGVPIVIKESMDMAGLPSTGGWAPLSAQTGGINLLPIKHSVVVQRMVDAGAIVLGKTNIPAFSDDGTRANSSWAGPTYNAINRELAPGASSSGTATAVAAGFAAAGLAEETGGSIQNPSAAQSLVGLKPTFALVPTTGVMPLGGSTRDVVGPIAKTVRDAALMLDVMAGYSVEDPKTSASNGHLPTAGYTSLLSKTALQGKRIGLYGHGWRLADLTPETQALYAKAIQELKARGAEVVTDPFAGSGFAELALPGEPYDYRGTESAAYDFNRFLKGLGVSSLAALKQMTKASPFDAGSPLHWYVQALPVLQASLLNPELPPDLSGFEHLRDQYLQIFNQVMTAQQLDAMVLPHAIQALPALFSDQAISETTVSAVDIAGLPAITVPAGQYTSNKAPFSLIFVGRKWSEAPLLGMAYDYEQATRHRIRAHLLAR